MSDQMSVETIRTKLTENLDRMRKASAEYFQMLEKGLASSQLPAADQAKQFCDHMQSNMTATFDLCEKLIHAKDAQDTIKIQSEFFQDQMRLLTNQARSISEQAMKAVTGAFMPKS